MLISDLFVIDDWTAVLTIEDSGFLWTHFFPAIHLHALSGQARFMKALRLQGMVDAKHDEMGGSAPMILFWINWFEEYVDGARKAVGKEKAALYEQEGRQMGFENAVEYTLDFERD